MIKRDFIEAIEYGKPYDFIATNYHLMDKSELKDICLECLFQMTTQEELNLRDELESLWEDELNEEDEEMI